MVIGELQRCGILYQQCKHLAWRFDQCRVLNDKAVIQPQKSAEFASFLGQSVFECQLLNLKMQQPSISDHFFFGLSVFAVLLPFIFIATA